MIILYTSQRHISQGHNRKMKEYFFIVNKWWKHYCITYWDIDVLSNLGSLTFTPSFPTCQRNPNQPRNQATKKNPKNPKTPANKTPQKSHLDVLVKKLVFSTDMKNNTDLSQPTLSMRWYTSLENMCQCWQTEFFNFVTSWCNSFKVMNKATRFFPAILFF